mmetsp:Transcript_4594/g.13666  ORF Transcript_4594/g.13666 Transcript_4594/m.13666 type:complete len:252 (+) Transcript_4594:6165-6920(+)
MGDKMLSIAMLKDCMYQQAHCSATINRSPLAHYTHTFLSLSLGVWAVLGEREKGKKEERASRRPTNATETKPNQATITSPSPSPSTLPSTQAANQPNRLTAECHVVVKVMVMEREREREREREERRRCGTLSLPPRAGASRRRQREAKGVRYPGSRAESVESRKARRGSLFKSARSSDASSNSAPANLWKKSRARGRRPPAAWGRTAKPWGTFRTRQMCSAWAPCTPSWRTLRESSTVNTRRPSRTMTRRT